MVQRGGRTSADELRLAKRGACALPPGRRVPRVDYHRGKP